MVVVPAGQPDADVTTPTSPPPKPNAQPWRQSSSPTAPTNSFASKKESRLVGLAPAVRSGLSDVNVPSIFRPRFARSANAISWLSACWFTNQSLRSTAPSGELNASSQEITELLIVKSPSLKLPCTVSSVSISKHSPMPAGPVISMFVIIAPVWSRNKTPSESSSPSNSLPIIVMLATFGAEKSVPSPPSPSPSIPRFASELSDACWM